MIKQICGVCKSEAEKDNDAPVGCPVCGFGKEQVELKYIPYPVYPDPYPWYVKPYYPTWPYSPFTWTTGGTSPNTTWKITPFFTDGPDSCDYYEISSGTAIFSAGNGGNISYTSSTTLLS